MDNASSKPGNRSKTWIWHFDSPPEAIWPVLSDTARFNEAADLPRHTIIETPREDGSVEFLARARIGPFPLEWEENPVNWVDRQWFEHCRVFRNGPLEYLCATLRLFPEPGGCRCEYTVDVAPRNLLGRLLLATGFLVRIGRTFEPLADSAREFARGARDTEFDFKSPRLTPGARDRAADMVARIEATPHGHGLAARLSEHVLTRQEVDVWTIRPLQLARSWGVPQRHAIELCLEAVKQGLLRLRWDLLCPRCQVGKGTVLALDELPRGAHCGSCNIDYERDYANNVELAFHPANSIRPLESGEYCLFGPASTPHIKVQLTLSPGEQRLVALQPEHGRYRVRTLEAGPEQAFDWHGGAFPRITVDGDHVTFGEASGDGTIELANTSDRSLTLIIEENAWMRDALTAKRVTAMQAFRDLFDDDVLRPGDDVEIDHITIMFTDLKGSTALYERIGDPKAYALVRQHFAILGKAVREHDGAIVKTIGDAIMAVYVNPADGLRCALQIQDDIERFNHDSGKEPVIIKLGLHLGRCISVTLNNRLDYYGSAANKAARLEGQSTGGDIVLSPEYAADREVARLLADTPAREESAELKGFPEPIRFLRIGAEVLAERRRAR
ncbi:MAG: adenylate/guanylate cyclase domain-containing protein [Gammaproteobacteria bacterium]